MPAPFKLGAKSKLLVKWDGLDEFKRELQVLNAGLLLEAQDILFTSAVDAANAVRAAYPFKKGDLIRGVVVLPSRGTTLAGAVVKNLAPHALWYEEGTEVRETGHGFNRGRMPAKPTFRPITDAYHDAAITAIIDRLYAHGAAQVTGDPDTD